MRRNEFKSKSRINKIEATEDTLTGRGGVGIICKVFRAGRDIPFTVKLFWKFTKEQQGATGMEYIEADILFFL